MARLCPARPVWKLLQWGEEGAEPNHAELQQWFGATARCLLGPGPAIREVKTSPHPPWSPHEVAWSGADRQHPTLP